MENTKVVVDSRNSVPWYRDTSGIMGAVWTSTKMRYCNSSNVEDVLQHSMH